MADNMTSAPSASDDFAYKCVDPTQAEECAPSCIGLSACQECQCAIVSTLPGGGSWGQAMDFIFCLLPIVFLIVVTVKPNPMSTTRSLPCAALLMLLVRTMYLASDPLLTCASVISGLHEALTPLSSKCIWCKWRSVANRCPACVANFLVTSHGRCNYVV